MRGDTRTTAKPHKRSLVLLAASPLPPPHTPPRPGPSSAKLLRTMTVSDPLVSEGQESPREDTKRIALLGGLEVWNRVESWTWDEQNGRLGRGQEGIWSPEDRLLPRLSKRSDQELTGASIECLVLIERTPQLLSTSEYL